MRKFYITVSVLAGGCALHALYTHGAVWDGLALAGATGILTLEYISYKMGKL